MTIIIENKINSAQATIVYVSEDGEDYTQLVSDITYTGALINPETGDDMEIDHVIINEQEIDAAKVIIIYTSEGGDEYTQPVADITYAGALIDPDNGDDMEIAYVIIAE